MSGLTHASHGDHRVSLRVSCHTAACESADEAVEMSYSLNSCSDHYGKFIYTATLDGNRRVMSSIDRADPEILVADEVLCSLAEDDDSQHLRPGLRLIGQYGDHWYAIAGHHGTHPCISYSEPYFCFTGCTLIAEPLHGDKLIYVMGEYDNCCNAWHARWPD